MLDSLLRWGGKRTGHAETDGSQAAPGGEHPLVPSKALTKFLATLTQRESPIVIDFGPVIGGNVSFLGERLGCKLVIEDLFADFERHSKAGTLPSLGAALQSRLHHADESIDGVLCWDFFDLLDKGAAQTLARQVVRLLRPGGAVMGFFCTSPVPQAPFVKYEIVGEHSLRHRPHAGAGGAKHVLLNRDIIKMFDGLIVSDSFLLKSNTREILLRRR